MGSSSDHVGSVLLMTWGIGDNELALLRTEVAIGNIDRDALLPLGLQAIQQQGEIWL